MQMMKRNKKDHDNQNVKSKRFFITVNVLGSSGPLRFVVNDDVKVSEVIDSSLKIYARNGRLPVLGSDISKFLLYPSNAGSDAMKANDAVGSCEERTFVLCKNPSHFLVIEARSDMISRHRWSYGCWKAWFKIISL